MSLDKLFEMAGRKKRFEFSSYQHMPYGDQVDPTIKASSVTCEFMMEAARNAGDLMAAARDGEKTLKQLRRHEALVASITEILHDRKMPNALAAIAIQVAEFNAHKLRRNGRT